MRVWVGGDGDVGGHGYVGWMGRDVLVFGNSGGGFFGLFKVVYVMYLTTKICWADRLTKATRIKRGKQLGQESARIEELDVLLDDIVIVGARRIWIVPANLVTKRSYKIGQPCIYRGCGR